MKTEKSVRARMLNPEILCQYFDEIEAVIAEGSNQEHIWNFHETGLIKKQTPVKVYARKGEKAVVRKVKSSNSTVMSWVSDVDECMSPMFLTKGKNIKNSCQLPNRRVYRRFCLSVPEKGCFRMISGSSCSTKSSLNGSLLQTTIVAYVGLPRFS